jgi:hypothetical protein
MILSAEAYEVQIPQVATYQEALKLKEDIDRALTQAKEHVRLARVDVATRRRFLPNDQYARLQNQAITLGRLSQSVQMRIQELRQEERRNNKSQYDAERVARHAAYESFAHTFVTVAGEILDPELFTTLMEESRRRTGNARNRKGVMSEPQVALLARETNEVLT